MTYQPLIDNLKVLAIRQSELGNNGWASWASQAASAIADLSDFEQTMIARRGEIERTADDLERCRAALGGLIEALEFEMQDNHHPLHPRAVVCLAMVEAREALK